MQDRSVGRGVRGPLVRRSWFAAAVAGTTVLAAGCGAGTKAPSVASIATPGSTTTSVARSAGGPTTGKSYSGEVAYSRCMRSHGLPNFPDPSSAGHLVVRAHSGGDLNPSSPQYQSADQACRHQLPHGGQATPAQQRQELERFLRYARCMRSHAIPNFPDPTLSAGVISVMLRGTGIDPASPRYQSAQHACRSLSPGG